jgi:signal transduction histidine kinase
MVCNDVVMPALLRVKALGLAKKPDLTRLLLWVRRIVMIAVMALGYFYMRHDSAQFALVSIGLMSFVAVAQFAPAIVGGLFWRGATKAGAFAGISAGVLVWAYTLLLPSFARSGALGIGFVADGPFGVALLKPYTLLGLTGLDPVTHSAFWSLLVNIGAFTIVSLAGHQSPVEQARAALFVDTEHLDEVAQIWRRTARVPDLMSLVSRFLGREKAAAAFAGWAHARGLDPATAIQADAETVLFYERLLAGVIGAASARVLVSAIVEEEQLGVDEMMRILDETSRIIEANRQLEDKSRALEMATAELTEANAQLQVLDRLKDDFVATVIRESTAAMHQVFAASQIELALRIEADPAIVMGDHDRLVQVVINLLGNAAKFSPAGRGRATLWLRRVGREFEITVSDNGPGIRATDREIVFERFRQLGDMMSDKPQGAGLGLAISQRIITQHGGRIWVEDAKGGGAAFHIRLTRAPAPALGEETLAGAS